MKAFVNGIFGTDRFREEILKVENRHFKDVDNMSSNDFFLTIERRYGIQGRCRIFHQMDFLYKDIEFEGKTVLDIGGGVGLHSFYAASRGASSVTVIEPEGDGGHNQMVATFNELRNELKCTNVELIHCTLQDYSERVQEYDIVLIQDAINHFNEEACITLRSCDESWRIYERIFNAIAKLIRSGGFLVLSDCSSRNVFPQFGMKNPIDPNIEWHKHQPPLVWARLAHTKGLKRLGLRWSTPTRFGRLGKILMGNCLAAWFFTSHFTMTFQKDMVRSDS